MTDNDLGVLIALFILFLTYRFFFYPYVKEKKIRGYFDTLSRRFELEHIPWDKSQESSVAKIVNGITSAPMESTFTDECLSSRAPDNPFHVCHAYIYNMRAQDRRMVAQFKYMIEALVLHVPMETGVQGKIHIWSQLNTLTEKTASALLGAKKLSDPFKDFPEKFMANSSELAPEIQEFLLSCHHRYPFGKKDIMKRIVGRCQDLFIAPDGFVIRGIFCYSEEDVKSLIQVGRGLKEALIKSGAGKALQPGSSSRDAGKGDDGDIYRIDI